MTTENTDSTEKRPAPVRQRPVERPRPDVLVGLTHKFKAPNLNGETVNIYVTINEDEHGDAFEVFINTSDAQLYESLASLTLSLSRQLRIGVPIDDLVQDLMQVASAQTAHWDTRDKSVWHKSLHAHIGYVLQKHGEIRHKQLALSLGDAGSTAMHDQ